MGNAVLASALAAAVTAAAADAEFARAARGWSGKVVLVDADRNTSETVLLDDGRPRLSAANDNNPSEPDVVLRAPAETWLGMLDPAPRPFLHDLSGARRHGLTVDGDAMVTAQRWTALNRLMQLAREQTWRLVLVGDPHQLQAVGRGGMFAELCSAGRTIELERIHRFVNPWEAAASLQLRHGDTRSLDTYGAHDRILPGNLDQHLETIATY